MLKDELFLNARRAASDKEELTRQQIVQKQDAEQARQKTSAIKRRVAAILETPSSQSQDESVPGSQLEEAEAAAVAFTSSSSSHAKAKKGRRNAATAPPPTPALKSLREPTPS